MRKRWAMVHIIVVLVATLSACTIISDGVGTSSGTTPPTMPTGTPGVVTSPTGSPPVLPTGEATPLPTPTPIAGSSPTIALPLPTGRIVFEKRANVGRGYDSQPSICTMPADGSRPPVVVTEGHNPRWAPDGTRIAFERVVGDNRDIWVINADGTQETRLTREPGCETDLDWTPDGQGIIFTGGRCDDGWAYGLWNTDIYYVKADGTGLVNLTNTPSLAETSAYWSPDGQRVAYRAWDFQNMGSGDQICIMNADGSKPTVVSRCPEHCSFRGWSPDGRQLLINMSGESHIVALDGSTVVVIPRVNGEAWAPDGRHIVAVGGCAEPRPGETNSCLYMVSVDGSGQQQLTASFSIEPSWSPDGQWIVFRSWGLWLVRADGSQLVPLTDENDYQYLYFTPVWAPK